LVYYSSTKAIPAPTKIKIEVSKIATVCFCNCHCATNIKMNLKEKNIFYEEPGGNRLHNTMPVYLLTESASFIRSLLDL